MVEVAHLNPAALQEFVMKYNSPRQRRKFVDRMERKYFKKMQNTNRPLSF